MLTDTFSRLAQLLALILLCISAHLRGVSGLPADRKMEADPGRRVLRVFKYYGSGENTDPVSYTHLDVYKRQDLQRTFAGSGAEALSAKLQRIL